MKDLALHVRKLVFGSHVGRAGIMLCLTFNYPVMAQVPATSHQVLVTIAPDWDAPQGQLYRFSRQGKTWRRVGEMIVVQLGKNGLAWGRGLTSSLAEPQKHEGDGRSPAGIFKLTEVHGYGAKPPVGTTMPYRHSQASDRCVDDSDSLFYNQILPLTSPVAWTSAETMQRDDVLYQLLVVVAHNPPPAVAHGGSCIFLHVQRSADSPTVGCTAMALAPLTQIVRWLRPQAQPLLIQLPRAVYMDQQTTWGLPRLPAL